MKLYKHIKKGLKSELTRHKFKSSQIKLLIHIYELGNLVASSELSRFFWCVGVGSVFCGKLLLAFDVKRELFYWNLYGGRQLLWSVLFDSRL